MFLIYKSFLYINNKTDSYLSHSIQFNSIQNKAYLTSINTYFYINLFKKQINNCIKVENSFDLY